MMHNVRSIMVLAAAVLLPTIVAAQTSEPDLDAARAELQAGRDQIIREDLQLSSGVLAAFWPVYEEYVAEISVLRDRKTRLIQDFMRAYQGGEFTDEFAGFLIKENFALKRDWAAVQESYVERFNAVMPVQMVARFYQLENKLDAEVDAQLALIVPLVE